MKLEQAEDRDRENMIAQKVAGAWNCSFGSMGEYSPFDKYFHRNGRMCALVEIKARLNREFESFDTCLLNLDKYFTLITGEILLKIPALYILGFAGGIYYVRVGDVPITATGISVKGRVDRGAINDVRPTIAIQREWFKAINLKGNTGCNSPE